ncbi:MAG: Choline-sulfatase [Phycisphaerales bacterium]|nr:Choline-sulfatase [Phycisphaerales bacterium]
MHVPLAVAAILFALGFSSAARAADAGEPPGRPNILWLTTEDIGPHLGCYGDGYADTPALDRLAGRSLRYLNCWSNAPVCAPARTTIISGLYPTGTGAEHMRSLVPMPAGTLMFPQRLRAAGYYCTNNVKEDYNLVKPGKVWDESSAKAHWRNRRPDQPFFAVFNFFGTHESLIRRRPHVAVHDPAKAPLPAYHPDDPDVRRDWAQYYDNITTMDRWVAAKLGELAAAGLADDTVVVFFGDHGSGMPRSKRTPCNSGLSVPFIIHVPAKWKRLAPPEYAAGGATDRLVSFVDLAPTVCGWAGAAAPDPCDGVAFAGPTVGPSRKYVYGFRGRMDERLDLARSARDKRFVYVRNYMPHRPAGQHNAYMFETPATAAWRRLYDAGKLAPPQTYFWEPKPPEELYDLTTDKDEVRNLAGSPEHAGTLARMRKAVHDWVLATNDVGLLPEGEIHSRSTASTPYALGRDRSKYPLERVLETAELASNGVPAAAGDLVGRLRDEDSAVRYWAATGLLARGQPAATMHAAALRVGLADASPYVRGVVGEALGKFGGPADRAAALEVLIGSADVRRNGVFPAVAALAAIDELGAAAAPLKDRIAALPRTAPGIEPRMKDNAARLIEHIAETLGLPAPAAGPAAPPE